MIAIALADKTVEVTSINTSTKLNDKKEVIGYQLWATKKSDGKSLMIFEHEDESEVNVIKAMINKSIELGEYLADLTKG